MRNARHDRPPYLLVLQARADGSARPVLVLQDLWELQQMDGAMTTKIEEIMSRTMRAGAQKGGGFDERAREVLTALDIAGLAVLPKAPTDKMMLMGGFSFAGSCPNDEVFPKTRKIWDKMTAAFDPQTWKPSE